ncbi:MAG: bifunctional pyr operon transcriptional regulator/uracil phosphoribosyltransferase, partial [Candidatus Rokubacteria bacterium]|nr:bifunctional pyr operon transcriptional regulator/uracil phosphoribosyltransferase [Candidatus Rokubacteria bacterium]
MTLKEKAEVMDGPTVDRSLTRIAHEILERNQGGEDLALVGIRTRGVILAHRIAENIRGIEGTVVPVGVLDITLYRDDLGMLAEQPVIKGTEIP